jgi:hypothetical protein
MITSRWFLPAFILLMAAALLFGCVGMFPITKKQGESSRKPTGKQSVQKAEIPKEKSDFPSDETTEPGRKPRDSDKDLLPPPKTSPKYEPPPPPPADKSVVTALALRDKDEINKSALKFAKNFKRMEHVKTCYSKMFGGWYVLLYIKNKNKYDLNQYSWNAKNKEWELMYINKNISVKQLKFLLESEVEDEKCFLLK